MADKICNDTIVNIAQSETDLPIYLYTCKGLFPNFIRRHVSFNQNIFAGFLLFLPMKNIFASILLFLSMKILFQILLMR